jgi:predicted phage-related endonuclease
VEVPVSTAPALSRERWLDLRREYGLLGSSSAAAACGLDQHESPLALYLRLRGDIPAPDLSENEYVHFGNVLEPVVIAEYARRLKKRVLDPKADRERIEAEILAGDSYVIGWVEDRQAFVRSKSRPWQSATLDAVAIDEETGEFEVVEAKNQGEYRSNEWADEAECPDSYRIQCLHHLAVVSAAPRVTLAAIVGGNRFRSVTIERDAKAIADLCTIEGAFIKAVNEGCEPIADGSEATTNALKRLHPDDDGSTLILPSETVEIRRQLAEIDDKRAPLRDQIDALEVVESELENRLRQIIGAHTFGQLPDGTGTYSLKTTERKGYVVKPTKYRTLRFAAPKVTTTRR